MKRMLIICLLFTLSAATAYAGWATLRNSSEVEQGTEANPIYIKLIN